MRDNKKNRREARRAQRRRAIEAMLYEDEDEEQDWEEPEPEESEPEESEREVQTWEESVRAEQEREEQDWEDVGRRDRGRKKVNRRDRYREDEDWQEVSRGGRYREDEDWQEVDRGNRYREDEDWEEVNRGDRGRKEANRGDRYREEQDWEDEDWEDPGRRSHTPLILALLLLGLAVVFLGAVIIFQAKSGNTVSDLLVNGNPLIGSSTDTEESGDAENGTDAAESETATEAETTSYVGTLPDIDISSWEFVLVNADNPIGEYEPEVKKVGRVKVDTRIADALSDFVQATKDQGLPIYLSTAYRDYDFQASLYKKKIKQGYSESEAATIVAAPGTSEHQTGLAIDITDKKRDTKNEDLENTETYQWMSAHCQEYGFIVRYPKGKEDVTGIIYEPWHYRYVGVEAATFIMNNNLTLEEFLDLYKED